MEDNVQSKRPPGRPPGSGQQLPTVERTRKSRANRAAAGATRLDLTLDADHAEKLATLMQQWQCGTRKEVIERAIATAYTTVRDQKLAVFGILTTP